MGAPWAFNGGMRFLCDEMLHGLARWLRAAGYDAAGAHRGADDRSLIARTAAEGRLLLTRDRAIAHHRAARGRAVILDHDTLDALAREVRERLGVNWLHAPFTRCLICNVPLEPARPADLARLPGDTAARHGPLRRCPSCKRVYWPGSHIRRMRARLERWQTLSGGKNMSIETQNPPDLPKRPKN